MVRLQLNTAIAPRSEIQVTARTGCRQYTMREAGYPTGSGRSPFGVLLREFRIAARLSQEMLAERARVSVACVSVLERGVRRLPHRETVALLVSALDLSPQDRARLQAAAMRKPGPRRRLPSRPVHAAQIESRSAATKELLAACNTERSAGDRHDERLFGNAGFGGIPYLELIAATLGIALRYHEAEPTAAAAGQIVDKRLVIVLGNVAQVLGAASAVTQQIVERLAQHTSYRDEP